MIYVDVCPIIDAQESHAVSEEGNLRGEIRNAVLKHAQETAQDWSQLVASALREIGRECRFSDWDGEGAVAVSDFAIHKAARLAAELSLLVSPGIPAPELSPCHDGEITLSWIRSPKRLFSVSVGAHNNINFAGRIREGFEPHDVARFDAEDRTALLRMSSLISQLYSAKIS